MAIEAKKYLTPLIYKGDPVTFPTFGSQVFLSDGTPLEKDGTVNANTLGGVAASEYALKFESWSDEEKNALVEYVLSNDTNNVGLSVDDIYPVGSIYMSVDSTSPASRFANTTWEQLKDRFLIGAGDSYSNGSTGGAAEVLLDEKHLPGMTTILAQYSNLGNNTTRKAFTSWGLTPMTDWKVSSSTLAVAGTDYEVAHSNMPPYLTVYMWKRVS